MTNVPALARRGVNVVLGTTGWQAHEAALPAAVADRRDRRGCVAPNFSAGVVLFEAIVAEAARADSRRSRTSAPGFTKSHHAAKKDAPSGTALLLKRAMEEAGYARPIDVVVDARGLDSRHAHGRLRRPGGNDDADPHGARPQRPSPAARSTRRSGSRASAGWFTMRDVLGHVSHERPELHRRRHGARHAVHEGRRRSTRPAVRRLARRQVDAGVHFLVPCGTTGESPTLIDGRARPHRRDSASKRPRAECRCSPAPAATTRAR